VTYLIIASVYRERARKRIIEIREGKGTASLAQAGLMLFGMPAIGSTVDYRKFIDPFPLILTRIQKRDSKWRFRI